MQENNNTTTKTIVITSGKGGVGKTNLAANLALAISSLGKKVCIMDADFGLANINILLGLHPEFDLQHVIFGDKDINEIIIDGPGGIQIIPASSGVQKLAELTEEQRDMLINKMGAMNKELDIMIIDTAAGISSNVISFVTAADTAIVIVSPEPTSLTDAYALIKVLVSNGYKKTIFTIVNMVPTPEKAVEIYKKLAIATKKYLNIDLRLLGFVLEDKKVKQAVIEQTPVYISSPNSLASKCFQIIARKLLDLPQGPKVPSSLRLFWQQAVSVLKTTVTTRSQDKQKDLYPSQPLINRVQNIFNNTKDISKEELLATYYLIENEYKKRYNVPIDNRETASEFNSVFDKIINNEKELLTKLADTQIEKSKQIDKLIKIIAGQTTIGVKPLLTASDLDNNKKTEKEKTEITKDTKKNYMEELNFESFIKLRKGQHEKKR